MLAFRSHFQVVMIINTDCKNVLYGGFPAHFLPRGDEAKARTVVECETGILSLLYFYQKLIFIE